MRQIRPLLLAQRGGGHDHAGGAEAALEGLRIEEGLLHRMQRAVLGQPLDGGDLAAGGAEGRHQAGMHRLAVEPDRAGAAIAGIAALLDAEHAAIAQEGAQALSGRRLGGEQFAVDVVVHPGIGRAGTSACFMREFRLRQLGADLLGEVAGQVALVGGGAVDVVEIAVGRDTRVDRVPQLDCRWCVRSAAGSGAGWPR